MFDIEKIRNDFPQIHSKTNGESIIYFDNAATTLKPKSVIDAMDVYNSKETANVHRGVHTLSEISTSKYELTRDKLVTFLNAKVREEIIFTKGTTESINLLAQTYGVANLKKGDEILISYLEHHSNIVPWQILCEKTLATLKVIPVNDKGELELDSLNDLINSNTKIISFNYVSNALGTINPVKDIIKLAKENSKAIIHIDAAQACGHMKIDVQDLDCDFLSLSAHKMFGPTGIGLLYGKEDLLNAMPPFLGGGDMIDVVTFEKTTYNKLPYKFEAGTPNISNTIAWGDSIDYMSTLDFKEIQKHEDGLLSYATDLMNQIEGVHIVGTAKHKASVISFVMDGLHPHDIASMMNKYNIAIRTGHHCTQPLMKRMNVPATARASFSIYNTKEEIDKFIDALKSIKDIFC